MEHRFGVKDLFLFLLIGALIALVIMAMVQYDRQYEQVLLVKEKQAELTRDLVAIRQQLAQGVVAVGPGGGQPSTAPHRPSKDAFYLVRDAEKKPDFARGDWFIDNFGSRIGKITPVVSQDVYQNWVEYNVCESLAWRDPYSLEFLPRLATHWEVSPDGLHMRFFLRRGVTFSDGEPFTADDVVWTFNWIKNPAVAAARHRSYLEKLKEVRKVDDYTVDFTFSEFYFQNFSYVAGGDVSVLPEHFYSKFSPDEFNERTGLLMGTGPYRLENPESWTPGQPVELVRNDRYWGPPGTFDRIVFRDIEEDAAEMVAFGNQEIDHVHAQPEPFHQMRQDKRILAMSNHYSYPSVFTGYRYCAWNQVRRQDGKEFPTFFADKRVRQAMTMLLDRQRIVDEIAFGLGTVATGPFAPFSRQYALDVKAWPFDPDRGKSLLREAGLYDRNGDGVIESADGKPFRFTVTYVSTVVAWQKIALFIKDSMARAGIVVEFDPVDWPVLLKKMTQGDFDAVCLAWSGVVETDPYQIFHSSQIKDQGDNRTGYRNPELDKLIEKARTTVDESERMKLWNQCHRILHEDQPYTFIFNRNELRFVNKRITNLERSKLGLNYEHLNGGNIPWYVPKQHQRYTK